MNRKIQGLLAALALAAGCEFAEKVTYEGPIDACRAVYAACSEDKECCSYGCVAGVCLPGDHEGAACRNTTDCGYSDLGSQMLCKSGACDVPVPFCRDDADVCSSATQCCSHHCSGTACVPNRAPVVDLGPAVQTVPRNQPWTVVNTSADPDAGDTLSFGWTITRLPFGTIPADTSLSSLTVRNPIFTPGSTITSYRLDLDATDNWGLTRSGSVQLDVVNSAPVVTPGSATATTARNVALSIPMTASDANGDTLSCTWSVCRAGGAPCLLPAPVAPAPFVALPGTPANPTAAFPLGLTPADEGAWDVTLSCSDGDLTTAGTTTVTVTNSPPVVTPPAARTYNLSFVANATPEQTIIAPATDANGDAVATWLWEVVSAPEAVSLTGAATDTVGFAPNLAGLYTLRVTACDAAVSNAPWVVRAGDCGQATVVATVHPYIRPLASGSGSVVDATWRKSDDRLVAVGSDSGATGRLWLVNPAADPGSTPDTALALGAAPLALSVRPDGLAAVVGEATTRWQTVTLGATPAASALFNGPFNPTGVVHYDSNRAFAIQSGAATPVYDLDLGAGTYSAGACSNCTLAGSRAVTDGSALWMLNAAGDTVARYSVNNGNGTLTRDAQGSAPAAATDLWRSSDPQYLFLAGTNGILVSSTLAAAGSLPAGATHADSSLTLTSLVGLAATGATVTPFGSSLAAGAPIALPRWGDAGASRTLTSRYAFVSADGTRAHVVVQSSAPAEWGLYSCTLPCALP